MPLDLDTYLGVHQQALQVYARRSELLAENLANADTPNYKARDLDFRSVLASAATGAAPVQLAATRPGHLAPATTGTGDGALKYRIPLAPSLDGNTVDPQLEQAAFADNSIRYQAALSFLTERFKGLMTALTGQ